MYWIQGSSTSSTNVQVSFYGKKWYTEDRNAVDMLSSMCYITDSKANCIGQLLGSFLRKLPKGGSMEIDSPRKLLKSIEP